MASWMLFFCNFYTFCLFHIEGYPGKLFTRIMFPFLSFPSVSYLLIYLPHVILTGFFLLSLFDAFNGNRLAEEHIREMVVYRVTPIESSGFKKIAQNCPILSRVAPKLFSVLRSSPSSHMTGKVEKKKPDVLWNAGNPFCSSADEIILYVIIITSYSRKIWRIAWDLCHDLGDWTSRTRHWCSVYIEREDQRKELRRVESFWVDFRSRANTCSIV